MPSGSSLPPKIYLADVQVERLSRSLPVHHPITISCNYISGSHDSLTALCKDQ
uniref:Uncharacterized protein n=1 Tax=Suricata suricatta TaxID=37032 RepID=A0A673T0K5_SURSU